MIRCDGHTTQRGREEREEREERGVGPENLEFSDENLPDNVKTRPRYYCAARIRPVRAWKFTSSSLDIALTGCRSEMHPAPTSFSCGWYFGGFGLAPVTVAVFCMFGLVGHIVWWAFLSEVKCSEVFNASLEPQPRARRRARLAEDAPAGAFKRLTIYSH